MYLRDTYARDKEVKAPNTRSLDEIIASGEFNIATVTLDAQAVRLGRDYKELIEIIDYLIDRVVYTDSERFK